MEYDAGAVLGVEGRRGLEGALPEYGFELTDDEMAMARALHAQAVFTSDAELEHRLSSDVVGHAG
ncbi:MAG TPA: hypothetical protein VIG64_08895 [Actinomycetota bacterium]